MNLNLNAPPQFNGTPEEQIRQVTRYLFQLQRDLNIALDGANQAVVQTAGQTAQTAAQKTTAEAAKSLKSLIIKTANFVKQEMDRWTLYLEGSLVSQSTFGEYQETVSNEIRATATEVVQSYNFEGLIQALETHNITTEQYIKAGLLYFDDWGIPRYGVAVGENLTTVMVDGEPVLERAGLAATFTSDRLSFWLSGVEVAYVSNNQLYIREATILSNLNIGNWVIETTHGYTLKWAGG